MRTRLWRQTTLRTLKTSHTTRIRESDFAPCQKLNTEDQIRGLCEGALRVIKYYQKLKVACTGYLNVYNFSFPRNLCLFVLDTNLEARIDFIRISSNFSFLISDLKLERCRQKTLHGLFGSYLILFTSFAG